MSTDQIRSVNENAQAFMHLPCHTFAPKFVNRLNGLAVRVLTDTKFCDRVAIGSAVRGLETDTDGSIFITFTIYAGGKNHYIHKLKA